MKSVWLLMTIIALSGCSKTPTAASIVGEWRKKIVEDGSTVTFHADGRFVYSNTILRTRSKPHVLTGKWKIQGELIEATVIEQEGHLNSFYHFKVTPAGDIMLKNTKIVESTFGEYDGPSGIFFEGPHFIKP